MKTTAQSGRAAFGRRLARATACVVCLGTLLVGGVAAADGYVVEPGDTVDSVAVELGLSAHDLMHANGLSEGDELTVGQNLVLPAVGEGEPEEVLASGETTIIPGVPAYQQQRSLSCEYASVYIATSAFGGSIYEDDYIASTPQVANPHDGFRGNIDGEWGNTTDYGIYAEALVPGLERHGYVGEVSYGADAGTLRAHLDTGHPTIVWLGLWGDTGFYESDESGASYKLVPGVHVMVAYGYDADGVYLSDPGTGNLTFFDWGALLNGWAVMDGMALAVYPA